MERQILKRVIIPPLVIAACWVIFTYGGIIHFMSSKGDYISVFCFAALVVSLLIVPSEMISYFMSWLHAPSQDENKVYAYSSFIGWALALVLLIGGFIIVPWGKGWP